MDPFEECESKSFEEVVTAKTSSGALPACAGSFNLWALPAPSPPAKTCPGLSPPAPTNVTGTHPGTAPQPSILFSLFLFPPPLPPTPDYLLSPRPLQNRPRNRTIDERPNSVLGRSRKDQVSVDVVNLNGDGKYDLFASGFLGLGAVVSLRLALTRLGGRPFLSTRNYLNW
jgi:hypothetical protein